MTLTSSLRQRKLRRASFTLRGWQVAGLAREPTACLADRSRSYLLPALGDPENKRETSNQAEASETPMLPPTVGSTVPSERRRAPSPRPSVAPDGGARCRDNRCPEALSPFCLHP